MAHVQQLALDAIAAAIVAAGVVPPGRVFVDRVDPLQLTDLPCICIDEDGPEQVELYGFPGIQKRTLPLAIKCVVTASGTAADARALGLLVEKAVVASEFYGATCTGASIVSSDYMQSGSVDNLFNQRMQRWEFVYSVNAGSPDVFV